jgi:hypothetical protein
MIVGVRHRGLAEDAGGMAATGVASGADEDAGQVTPTALGPIWGAGGTTTGATKTGARKRYPRRGTVSRNRGLSAESLSAARKLYEGVSCPELLTDFLPRHQLTGAIEQKGKNLKRLLLQTNSYPGLSESTLVEVCFEGSKTDDPCCIFPHCFDTEHKIAGNFST